MDWGKLLVIGIPSFLVSFPKLVSSNPQLIILSLLSYMEFHSQLFSIYLDDMIIIGNVQ